MKNVAPKFQFSWLLICRIGRNICLSSQVTFGCRFLFMKKIIKIYISEINCIFLHQVMLVSIKVKKVENTWRNNWIGKNPSIWRKHFNSCSISKCQRKCWELSSVILDGKSSCFPHYKILECNGNEKSLDTVHTNGIAFAIALRHTQKVHILKNILNIQS